MIAKELKIEYESILLKRKKNYSSMFFGTGNKTTNEKNSLAVMQYCFENFLKWTPQDVYNRLDKHTLELMKLDPLLKNITFPPELNAKTDLCYIAHLIYPKEVPFNIKERVLQIYKRLLNRSLYRFPKEYIDGPDGDRRARICLRYMIRTYLSFHNIHEMYEFFFSPEGAKTLREYQLMSVCNSLYDTPVDYLHESLAETQQDEGLFHYYKFKSLYNKGFRDLSK